VLVLIDKVAQILLRRLTLELSGGETVRLERNVGRSPHRTDESITIRRPTTTAVSKTRQSTGADRKPKNRTFLPEKTCPHLGQHTFEDAAGSVRPWKVATPPQTRALRPSKFAEHFGQVSNPFIESLTLELSGGVAVRLERVVGPVIEHALCLFS
jgi:hypothetical protein